MAVFPFILMNLGKLKLFFLKKKIYQIGSWRFPRSCLWPMWLKWLSVLQLFRCIMDEKPRTITFQARWPWRTGGFHKLLGSSFKRVWEEHHDVVQRTLLHLGIRFKDTTLLPSCRKVLPPVQSGPQSACMCNWWRPSPCSWSQSRGDYLLPLLA